MATGVEGEAVLAPGANANRDSWPSISPHQRSTGLASAFGFGVGEERRYVMGPPRALAAGEEARWSLRLDGLSGDPPVAAFHFTHERRIPIPGGRSLVERGATHSGDILEAFANGTILINGHGFPEQVTFTTSGSLYGLRPAHYAAQYRFDDGAYNKRVRIRDRDWSISIPTSTHPDLDFAVPAGLYLFLPADLECTVPYLFGPTYLGLSSYRLRCEASEPAFVNPGLLSVALQIVLSDSTEVGDLLFFTPLKPEIYPGVIAGSEFEDVKAEHIVGEYDKRNYYEHLRLRFDRTLDLEIGNRTVNAVRWSAEGDLEAVYVDPEGRVLRIDLGRDPLTGKDRWIRMLFPSEY
jgi:hypothetical protein